MKLRVLVTPNDSASWYELLETCCEVEVNTEEYLLFRKMAV